MRFLILNTDYPDFIDWLYVKHPGLELRSYKEQMRARMESLFGVADFYSGNLWKLGHEAYDIYANNEFLQKQWARENDLHVEEPLSLSRQYMRYRRTLKACQSVVAETLLHSLKLIVNIMYRSFDSQQRWFYDILAVQIKKIKPDVLLNQAMDSISSRFLQEMKPYMRLLVGQHAATRLPDSEDWGWYDLVISSFRPTIDWFRQRGMPAELNRMGFEPRVLSLLKAEGRTFDVTFIGSLHSVHSSRVALLETLCDRFDQIRILGPDIHHLSPASPIRRCYVEQSWGRDMYQILHHSKITLNHHGDIAPYANNCRLYEATGVGTLLITDWKVNLHEVFAPGREVVAYRSPEECAEQIAYYLDREGEREAIAHAGQQRTLKEHTYYQRMQELVDTVNKYL